LYHFLFSHHSNEVFVQVASIVRSLLQLGDSRKLAVEKRIAPPKISLSLAGIHPLQGTGVGTQELDEPHCVLEEESCDVALLLSSF